MNISNCLLTVCATSLLALAACNDSDVPPGNNSTSVFDGQPTLGVQSEQVEDADIMPPEYTGAQPFRMASATLNPTRGNTASGKVLFIQPTSEDQRVRVVGKLVNISEGQHGFHIHENGDCTAPDASSAGEHFNPTNTMHGGRDAAERHAGDLGNITASADQVAEFDFYDPHLTFSGVNSMVEKAFVVHAAPDDLMSQPAGNSGDRIACGKIMMEQGV